MLININTESKTEKDFILRQVFLILIDLGIKRSKKFQLNINIVDDIDTYGYTDADWYNREFEANVDIKSNLNSEDFISTLAHELVHVKQFYRKELISRYPNIFWNGVQYEDSEQPWEDEAYDFEQKYLKKYLQSVKDGV